MKNFRSERKQEKDIGKYWWPQFSIVILYLIVFIYFLIFFAARFISTFTTDNLIWQLNKRVNMISCLPKCHLSQISWHISISKQTVFGNYIVKRLKRRSHIWCAKIINLELRDSDEWKRGWIEIEVYQINIADGRSVVWWCLNKPSHHLVRLRLTEIDKASDTLCVCWVNN